MRSSLLISMLLITLLSFSCSQYGRYYRRANKNYQKGQYDLAVSQSIAALRIKPENEKAQQLLVKAWQNALQQSDARVESLQQSSDPNKWDQIYREYNALNGIIQQLKSLPVLVNPNTGYQLTLNIPDIGQKLSSSRENAAEDHYQAGVKLSKMSSDSSTQKKAALEFKAAENLIANYKDAALKYEQSRKLAIRRLAVQPFEDKSATRNRYGAITDILTDQITSQIISLTRSNDFIEIIARSQMDAVIAEQQLNASGMVNEASTVRLGELLGAHEILTGRILQINETQERTVSVNQEAKARVVTGKEEYTDEQGNLKERDVWGDVSCQYRKYTKTSGVTVSASFSIIDVETGKIMLQESLEVRNPYSESWIRKISGDERALNNNLKTLMNKAEPFPPNVSEMVSTALRELGNNIVNKTRAYLN